MTKYIKTIFFSLIILLSSVVYAQEVDMDLQERQNFLRNKISNLDSGYRDAKIIPTSNPEFYLVVSDEGQKIYITKDGETLIFGSVFKNVDNNYLVDLENELLSAHRKDILSKLDKSSFVKYPATSEYKTDLYIFSDMSCPYCKKMHEDLDTIRDAGFDIYYIPYPRMGMERNLFAVKGLKKIICSGDPAKSFDKAFENPERYAKGIKDNEINCDDAKLLKDFYQLGDIMGVEGTPATFLPNGGYVSGFRSLPSFLNNLTKEYKIMVREEEVFNE